MITQEVNSIALAKAFDVVIGAEKTAEVLAVYRLIDNAMFAGYELGVLKASADVETKINAAFDTGYEEGRSDNNDYYDDGYVDGVRDARVRPEFADDIVANIIAAQTPTVIVELPDPEPDLFDVGCGDPYCHICGVLDDDFYEGDSGDETDR